MRQYAARWGLVKGKKALPCPNHALSSLTIPRQGWARNQVLHNLLAQRGQPELGQAVLVCDGGVIDAAEGQEKSYENTGPFCVF